MVGVRTKSQIPPTISILDNVISYFMKAILWMTNESLTNKTSSYRCEKRKIISIIEFQ